MPLTFHVEGIQTFFRATLYASAVYDMALRLCIRPSAPSVRPFVCHKPVLYQNG